MLATHMGFFNTSSTRTHVRFQFSTHAAAGGNVAPNSAFEAADLRIYKATDGAAFSATQRSSAAGITMTSPFDSLTGVHDVDIDLADNTDAGFYAAGCLYAVMLAPDETVDGQALTGVVLVYFEIGRQQADVREYLGSAAPALVGGRFDASVGAMANNVLVAAAIAADAFTAAKFHSDVTTEFQNGLATAAALQVIDDFLDTEIQAIKDKTDNLPSDPADQSLIIAATDAIMTRLGVPAGASLAADLAQIEGQTDDIGAAGAGLTAVPFNAAWAASIADAVWDALIASHADVGSTGEQLAAAGAAGDPWATALPGAYGAGTAGKIIGDNINSPLNAIKTDTAAILVDTGTTLDGKIDVIDGIVDSITARLPAALVSGRIASVAQVVDDKTGYALTVAERAAVSDKLLGRTRAGGADGGRTVAECLAFSRNRWEISAGTLTVYADDDATPLWTAAVATAPGDPITSADPA